MSDKRAYIEHIDGLRALIKKEADRLRIEMKKEIKELKEDQEVMRNMILAIAEKVDLSSGELGVLTAKD